ncbi:uncharacterized protein LOC111906273 [Lactuca sativa]|uniref:uncharacterized protein LOC111906273 n=1 Tax=Lactuca sativa TaxID=4236 RepID=UPI000CD9A255|nr:uncharacterized protein LOC111906273 [Lactuca sativa]
MAIFKRGLKPNIRKELRMWTPEQLGRAMDLAQQIEEKNQPNSNSGFGTTGPRSSTTLSSRGNIVTSYSPNTSTTVKNPSAWKRNLGEIRPLTEAQINEKRAKGLCYKCDEKWNKSHKCKSQINVILVEEEDPHLEHDPSPDEGLDQEARLESTEVNNTVEVSLNSIVGLTSPKTMKLTGRVWDKPGITLIDPGATHNFIASRVVEELGIAITDTKPYGVRMGTGDSEAGRGVCKGILLQLQEVDIVEEFLPLRLGSADVILGMKWLEMLGTTQTNWKEQTIEFEVGGQMVRLKGEAALGKSRVTLRTLERELKREGAGMVVEFCNTETEMHSEVPLLLTQILHKFKCIFQEPKELPPRRHLEHQIVLKDGTPPVSVRPYRYPHYQKDKIERLIQEMLTTGVIQVSNSPYSSPVILVKKKDGSWRFCVDYRALNRATVPDKFPILVINELLDELHGSVIFSKLDLRSGYHHIRVRTQDIPKTVFRTHDGDYEFKVMSFRLTNAPATFQSLMNDIFHPYLRKFILVFFDDILIYSPSEDLHQNHLNLAFEVLQKNQLFLNQKKCTFGQRKVSYLGHEISAQGVAAEASKVQAMLD